MNKPLLIFFLFLSTATFAQSGWVKEKGMLYSELSFASLNSHEYYNLDGVELRTSEFQQQSVLVYGEYGLGRRFSAVLNYVGYRWNAFETTDPVSGSGDAFVGLQYGILTGKFPLSILVGPEIPIGNADLKAQNNNSPFVDEINLPTGDGEWNVWSTMALSHSFPKLKMYATVTAGFNYRTKYEDSYFNNQVKSNLELGFQPMKKLWLQARLGIYQTLGTPESGVDFIRGEGTAFTTFGFALAYDVYKGFGIGAQGTFYDDFIVDRKNIYSAPLLSASLSFKIE